MMKKQLNTKRHFTLLISALVIVLITGAGLYVLTRDSHQSPSIPNETSYDVPDSGKDTMGENDSLLYLIEEEKLAYDVYTYLYERYGSTVFGNILKSELTHQNRVLELLEARGIPDPRSTNPGEFTNQELQELYDTLIKQGTINVAEAYNVGIAIEEKDIADLTSLISLTEDTTIISVLESLRAASQNHLKAFQKQKA
jgi:hypothetical protein